MNSSSSNNPQSSFDFSRPPPGYSAPCLGTSGNYASSPHVSSTTDYYAAGTKTNSGYTSTPEHSRATESRFAYYHGSNLGPNHSSQTARPRSQDRSESTFRPLPPPIPSETNMAVDPRIFGIPPPPPPADPYPANIAVPPAGYILSSTVYAFPVPPPAMGPIGAGQYLTQQPGNFRLPQFQGEYGTGYSKRGGFNNHLNRKRNMNMPQEYDSEGHKKGSSKKKKKPLSQNMPSKKDWSVEEAQRALDVEMEFNKRHKSPSLIIKFPDLELNRDIVSKFHPKIESVHFQQPSTPRFCFVTLRDSECMNKVIKELCKIKFGDGYLTAEPKNNKEEDLVKGPEDIDPLTLYVGNLAQEVTVDDVVKAFPKHKRIDIGFAKKMKYTRYAFVCFRAVDDAIEAFQNTHATEMYNKSLIVRFRRLHGTVGLPGDPKPQNPQRRIPSESSDISSVSLKDIENSDKIREPLSKREIVSVPQPDEYESYGEDLDYLKDLKSFFRNDEQQHTSTRDNRSRDTTINRSRCNSGGSHPTIHVKNEPIDYDSESYVASPEPQRNEEISHLPMIDVKSEPDVKPNIHVKLERQNLDGNVKNEFSTQPVARRRASSCSEDENIFDRPDDPFQSQLLGNQRF